MISRFIPVVELEDVAVVQRLEMLHLGQDFAPPGFLNRFDSNVFYGFLSPSFVDHRVLATTNFLVNVIIVHFEIAI